MERSKVPSSIMGESRIGVVVFHLVLVLVASSHVVRASGDPEWLLERGTVLDLGGQTLTVKNASRFLAEGKQTVIRNGRLVFDLDGMMSTQRHESVLSIALKNVTVQGPNTQVSFVRNLSRLSNLSTTVVVQIEVVGCTFSNATLAFSNITTASTAETRSIPSKQLRWLVEIKDSTLSYNLGSGSSPLPNADAPETTLSLIKLSNTSVGLASQWLVTNNTLSMTQTQTSTAARAQCSPLLFVGGTIALQQQSVFWWRRNTVSVSCFYSYGFVTNGTDVTVRGGSALILQANRWSIAAFGHQSFGVMVSGRALKIDEGSQYLIDGDRFTVTTNNTDNRGGGTQSFPLPLTVDGCNGLFFSSTNLTVAGRSRYLVNNTAWNISSTGTSRHTAFGFADGLYAHTSPTAVKNQSYFGITNSKWTLTSSGDSYKGQALVASNSALSVEDNSTYSIDKCQFNVTSNTSGSSYGQLHTGGSSVSIIDSSSFLISGCTWRLESSNTLGGTSTAFGVRGDFFSKSSLTISNSSQYNISSTHWTLLDTGAVAKSVLITFDQSPVSVKRKSAYVLKQTTGTLAFEASGAVGIYALNSPISAADESLLNIEGGSFRLKGGRCHGMEFRTSSLTVSNHSLFAVRDCPWALRGTGATYGMLFLESSPVRYENSSGFLLKNSNWTVHGTGTGNYATNGILFDHPVTVTNGSYHVFQGCTWSILSRGSDSLNYVHGIHFSTGGKLSVQHNSSFLIHRSNWMLTNEGSGILTAAIRFASGSPLSVTGQSLFNIQHSNWTIVSTQSNVFAFAHWKNCPVTISQESTYVIQHTTIVVRAKGRVCGILFRENSGLTLSNRSVYELKSTKWDLRSTGSGHVLGMQTVVSPVQIQIQSNSTFSISYSNWTIATPSTAVEPRLIDFVYGMTVLRGNGLRFFGNSFDLRTTGKSSCQPIRFKGPGTFFAASAVVASQNTFLCTATGGSVAGGGTFQWGTSTSNSVVLRCNTPTKLGLDSTSDLYTLVSDCDSCTKLDCNPMGGHTLSVTGTVTKYSASGCQCTCNSSAMSSTDPPYNQQCYSEKKNTAVAQSTAAMKTLQAASPVVSRGATAFVFPKASVFANITALFGNTATLSRTATASASARSFSPTTTKTLSPTISTVPTKTESASHSTRTETTSHLTATPTPTQTSSPTPSVSPSYGTLTRTAPPSQSFYRNSFTATETSASETRSVSMSHSQRTATTSTPDVFLFSTNSSDSMLHTDAILQNPRIIPSQRPNVTGVHLILQLVGDFFTAEPEAAVVPAKMPSYCLIYQAFYVSYQQYFQQSPPNVTLLNQSAMLLTFRFAELNTSADLRSLNKNDTISIGVNASCHFLGTPLKPLRFVFSAGTPPPPRPVPVLAESVQEAETTAEVTKIVAATAGAGMVAMQSSRSTVLLRMQTCDPDFNETLDWMYNPFQQSISDYPYKEFLASALLNQILIFAIPALQALGGSLHAIAVKQPIRAGFTWCRFPSLAVLPLMYFVEPTCYGAVVVIVYSEEIWHTIAAVVSLLLCYGLVFAIFFHLHRSWAAVMIPGVPPERLHRRVLVTTVGDDDLPKYESSWRNGGRRAALSLAYWIDGGVSWKDKPGHKGYCRSNRLLFMDYRGAWYWFLAVEMGVATVMGTLGGIQLGPGRCTYATFAVIVCLFAFLLVIAILRPYNAPFLGMFSVALTFLQLFASCFTLAHMVSGSEQYEDLSNGVVAMSLYLIVGRALFDVAPKFLMLGRTLAHWVGTKIGIVAAATSNTFEEHLMAVAQEQDMDREMDVQNRPPPGESLANLSLSFSSSSTLSQLDRPLLSPTVGDEGHSQSMPSAVLVMDRLEWDPEDFETFELPRRPTGGVLDDEGDEHQTNALLRKLPRLESQSSSGEESFVIIQQSPSADPLMRKESANGLLVPEPVIVSKEGPISLHWEEEGDHEANHTELQRHRQRAILDENADDVDSYHYTMAPSNDDASALAPNRQRRQAMMLMNKSDMPTP